MLNKCKLCRQQIPKGRWGQTLKPNLHGNLQVKIIYNVYNVTNCKILRTMSLVCLNLGRKIQVMLNTIRFRETESKKFRTTKLKSFVFRFVDGKLFCSFDLAKLELYIAILINNDVIYERYRTQNK